MKYFTTPEHCSHWFKQENGLLISYQKKTQQLLQLNNLWQHHVDQGVASNSCIANFQGATLVVEVANASWGTRLHYCIPDVLAQLQTDQLLQGLKNITWYIRPQNDQIAHEPLLRKRSELSLETQQLLHAVANTVTHDKLKMALRHLARA